MHENSTTTHNRPLIIHHHPCPDGFGAAYAAWCSLGDRAEYIGADYSNVPEIDVMGRDVYVLDFSFPRQVLESIRTQARSLVIIDHHKTACEDLHGFPGAIFDMDKSGARLAWEYFHPGKPVPMLLQYVEDRDIWAWRLVNSENFLAYLDTLPFDFAVWHELAHLPAERIARICEAGRHMNAKFQSLAREIADKAEPLVLLGLTGSMVNASGAFTSRVGELLYRKNGTFALIWRIEAGRLCAGLRAPRDGVDVSIIARHYGGGGHRAAAGFSLEAGRPEFEAFMAQHICKPGRAA